MSADDANRFVHRFTIEPDVIDRNGHVNNVAYVRWMQDVAVAHSRAVMEHGSWRDSGTTWVARSHQIEYLKPAFAGETISLQTWLSGFRRVRCTRMYEFVRESDGVLVARGQTDWVYVDADTFRPLSIPPSVRQAFGLSTDA